MSTKPYIYSDIVGLDLNDSSTIPREHLADSLNMIRRDDGLWENRKGFKQFGANIGSGEAIHSFRFWKTSLGVRHLTVGTGEDLYSYAEGSSYNDGTFTLEKSLTSDEPWQSSVYRDTIILCNGVDDVQTSTDNDTFTDRSGVNIYKFRITSQANDFVMYSDIDGDKDKVFLTAGAPADPWVTDPNNTSNLDIGNSDNITAGISLGKQIIVAKQKRCYALDLASLTRETIDWGGGAVGPRAVLQTQTNSVYIAGRQSIFTLARTQIGNNQLFGNPESDLVSRLYGRAINLRTLNSHYSFDTNSAYFNFDTPEGKVTLVKNLDYSQPVWTYFSGINSTQWELYEDADGMLHSIYADGATDRIWEMFVGRNDNGAPILSRMAFKNDDFDLSGVKKSVATIDITGFISANGVWGVELYIDDDLETPFKTATITYDNDAQLTASILGIGSQPLGSSPLGGLVGTDDDIPVRRFFKRINVHTELEKLQVVLINNQKDVRVVFDRMVIYAEGLPYDNFPNQNIE